MATRGPPVPAIERRTPRATTPPASARAGSDVRRRLAELAAAMPQHPQRQFLPATGRRAPPPNAVPWDATNFGHRARPKSDDRPATAGAAVAAGAALSRDRPVMSAAAAALGTPSPSRPSVSPVPIPAPAPHFAGGNGFAAPTVASSARHSAVAASAARHPHHSAAASASGGSSREPYRPSIDKDDGVPSVRGASTASDADDAAAAHGGELRRQREATALHAEALLATKHDAVAAAAVDDRLAAFESLMAEVAAAHVATSAAADTATRRVAQCASLVRRVVSHVNTRAAASPARQDTESPLGRRPTGSAVSPTASAARADSPLMSDDSFTSPPPGSPPSARARPPPPLPENLSLAASPPAALLHRAVSVEDLPVLRRGSSPRMDDI